MIRPLLRSAVVALAATLLVTAGQAQQTPPASAPRGATAPAAPAQQTPPASAPRAGTAPAAPAQPSASHLAAARELATLTGVLRVYDSFVPQFGEQVRKNAVTRPELTKDLDQVLEAMKPELEKQKQDVMEGALRFYTTAFTEAELKDLIAFFKTPTGRKYLEVGPRLTDALALETRRWSAAVSEILMSRIRAEMAKRGHQM